MNRELKFRVWDFDNKVFVYTDLLNIKAQNGNRYTNGEKRLWLQLVFESQIYPKVKEIKNLYDGGYKIQQFTGLKDKNNKEIYEGDIIKVAEDCYAFFDENVLLVVEWENHGFLCFDNLLARDTIVVGNIFENPNLING